LASHSHPSFCFSGLLFLVDTALIGYTDRNKSALSALIQKSSHTPTSELKVMLQLAAFLRSTDDYRARFDFTNPRRRIIALC
jgi:hypothetical protein